MGKPITEEAIEILFEQARSYDRFLSESVPDDVVYRAWDLLKMGPTSANQLPARLVWCKSAEARNRLAALAFGDNQEKIRKAPLAIIVAFDLDFHKHLPTLFRKADAQSWFQNPAARETSAFRNGTLQGAYLIFALRSLGLDVGPMSAFDNEGVDREFFNHAPSFRSNFLCVAGQGDEASLSPRDRRPEFAEFNVLM